MTVCSLLTSSILSVNFPIVSGGFALLATTGTALAGLGGGAGGVAGAVGAVLGPGGVVTGLMPIVGTLGLLGKDVIFNITLVPSMTSKCLCWNLGMQWTAQY